MLRSSLSLGMSLWHGPWSPDLPATGVTRGSAFSTGAATKPAPAMLHRANGFAVFQSCGTDHDPKLVLQYSIDCYGRTPVFSLPFGKYRFNLQTVRETKFSFGLKNIVEGILF